MIVIELEERKYGKSMEAISKIKEYAECLAEMFEEHSMGQRGGMSHRGGMGYRKPHFEPDYDDYAHMPKVDYRGDYGNRYM